MNGRICTVCKRKRKSDCFGTDAERLRSRCHDCERVVWRALRSIGVIKQRPYEYRKYPRNNKHKAREAVQYALRIGKLIRLPCQKCGDPKADAHHENYRKPLDVIWVCRPCHFKFHRKPVNTPITEEMVLSSYKEWKKK